MNKKKKADKIQHILKVLYPETYIPLKHKDSYTLLIAVLLSAQSTDARVNVISPKLFEKADTPMKMAKLTVEEIEEVIRPCGLASRKGKAISELSQILVEKYEGKVPDTFKALEDLPGVGHKTASVVMSQAFGHDAFPVDTHIHRLAKRWGLSDGTSVKRTEEDLKRIFPKASWNTLHIRMIFFGREYCPARGHNVAECPICSWV